jgi:hypothetical protein
MGGAQRVVFFIRANNPQQNREGNYLHNWANLSYKTELRLYHSPGVFTATTVEVFEISFGGRSRGSFWVP